MPEEKRPDVRPQLREFLAWYEEVLGRIESGAIVAQENRSASQKRRQPWLTFSISLIPARTSPPARRGLAYREERLLQAQCSQELGQPGSLGTLSPGCLADGTWRANPGLAPVIQDGREGSTA
jgi:hypothetical protein